jgi:general L-amino acid transport system ATP-binding protein
MTTMNSSDPGTAIIQCEDVEKWFGDFQALKGITTSVAEGEVVVIFGPSGSGKSTFIRTINRLEEHDAGRIVVDGVELNDDLRNLEQIRSEIGIVFQQFNLFPHLSVLRNVALGPQKVRHKPTNSPRNSPAASNNASPSPEPWPCDPRSCCSMSPPAPSIPR